MVTTSDAEDPSAVLDADVKAKQTQDRIHLLKQLRLGLSSTYYSMAQALGLRRLQDYFQVTFFSPISLGAPYLPPFTVDSHRTKLLMWAMRVQGTTSLLGASDPVWVLGVCYEGCPTPQGDAAPTLKQEVNPPDRWFGIQTQHTYVWADSGSWIQHGCPVQVLNAILSDLMSRIWMTYRKGFNQIGKTSGVIASAQRVQSSLNVRACASKPQAPALCSGNFAELSLCMPVQVRAASQAMWGGAARCGVDRCCWHRQGFISSSERFCFFIAGVPASCRATHVSSKSECSHFGAAALHIFRTDTFECC